MRRLLHMVSTLLCALMAAGAASSMAAPGAARLNHLKGSGSPYLQRAIQELVDWYPWGGEAFKKAKDLDRPILLDLGAKWCPYCSQLGQILSTVTPATTPYGTFAAAAVDVRIVQITGKITF
jgi:thiol-disulfide isomerase/thioredoxin